VNYPGKREALHHIVMCESVVWPALEKLDAPAYPVVGCFSPNPRAANDDGTYSTLSEVAGRYVDSCGVSHGFVYDNGTYTTLDAPGRRRSLRRGHRAIKGYAMAR
jgi:hypothetical protein